MSNTCATTVRMTTHPANHTTGPRIIDTMPLPPGIAGLTDGHTIWLSPTLTPAGRRCTLAHELAHIHRGIHPDLPPHLEQREERAVDRAAAHMLTDGEALLDAIIWAQGDEHRGAIAAELDIDQAMLDVRMRTATPVEAAAIREALENLGTAP